MTPLDIIKPVWTRLTDAPFHEVDLAKVILRDGGIDMEPLTDLDLIKLLKGEFDGKWDKVVFSFSELLAFYANGVLDNYQLIAWCFAVLVIGEANRRHHTGWEVHLYVITKAFDQVTRSLTYKEFSSVLKVALNPQSNEG